MPWGRQAVQLKTGKIQIRTKTWPGGESADFASGQAAQSDIHQGHGSLGERDRRDGRKGEETRSESQSGQSEE